MFPIRLTDEERANLEALHRADNGPRALGRWLVWRASQNAGDAAPASISRVQTPTPERHYPRSAERIILDLCAGSGAWSQPYEDAGYRVVRVSLPELDVRTYTPPEGVWGVLAAPPCEQFSMARRTPRDFAKGLEVVNACMRIILQCKPRWWALENPVGMLSKFLRTPHDVFNPCDFGDPWTKRTALWGDFKVPVRGPFVKPLGGGPFCEVCDPTRAQTRWCNIAAHRAVTPAGFARAFFAANP